MAGRSGWVVAGVAAAVLAVVGAAVSMTAGDAADAGPGSGGRHGQAPPRREAPSPVAPRDQEPGRDHRVTVPIQSYEVLAPNRLRLRYTTGVPDCAGRPRRAMVKEDDQEVVVVVVLRPPTAPADQPCPAIGLLGETVVGLAAPLRDRQVVDGSTGRPVRRGHRDLY